MARPLPWAARVSPEQLRLLAIAWRRDAWRSEYWKAPGIAGVACLTHESYVLVQRDVLSIDELRQVAAMWLEILEPPPPEREGVPGRRAQRLFG